MSGPRARWLLLAVVLAPLAAAPAGADEAAPAAAEWVPSGVGTVTASTYPEGTLHVGAAVGQETDRTYLRFDVPSDADDVVLTIVLDPAAGTSAPETAVVLACEAPAFDPAAVDCDGAPEAAYADGALTVPLPASGEVALVPGGDGTWHVGFASDAPRATFDVPPPTTTTTTAFVASSPPVAAPSAPLRPLPDLAPAAPVASGEAIAEQAAPPTTVVPVTAVASTVGGYRYPIVFALPLVLLVGVWLAGDGLTRPVRLREEAA